MQAEPASWGQHENTGLLSSAVTAFVSGSHQLNEQTTLILVADEVLGRQGLRKEWCRPIST